MLLEYENPRYKKIWQNMKPLSLARGSFIKQQKSLHCWKGLTISASPLKSPKVNARRDYNSSSLSLFFLYRKRWKLSQRGTMAISNWFSTFGIRSIVHPVAHLFQGLSKVYSDEDYKNKIKNLLKFRFFKVH